MPGLYLTDRVGPVGRMLHVAEYETWSGLRRPVRATDPDKLIEPGVNRRPGKVKRPSRAAMHLARQARVS